eukprot:TRINITY_DN9376_c0_g1_i3.p1 TRINITY_DN9376_c0_g1~~TRINITY_DN9376_c0_g1_i3.p1  ORF type:complete len:274 (-),score=51.56 TRINITY_DN9376_c0_g1_i3:153-974(-)
MCIRDRYQRRVRGDRCTSMGCAISEEDQQEDPSGAIVHDITVSGESGFKKVVKARRLLVIGREEDGRDRIMTHLVARHGNGQKAEPMAYGPQPYIPECVVAVDALPRLDVNRHKTGEEILPVNSYEVDVAAVSGGRARDALRNFAGGGFQAVVLVISSDLIESHEEGEHRLSTENENLYVELIEGLCSSQLVERVPVLILINDIQKLRKEGMSAAEFDGWKHKICMELKLSLIAVEEEISDLIAFTIDSSSDEPQGAVEAVAWLVRKVRKVRV